MVRKHESGVGVRTPAAGQRSPVTGFTLVELLVAMFITVLLGTIVVMAYSTSIQSYYHTERKLQALAAFRNTTDRMERELHSIVCKASVYSEPVLVYISNKWQPVLWETRIKYIHGEAWVNTDPYSWQGVPTHDGSAEDGGSFPVTHAGISPGVAPAGRYWETNPDGRGLYRIQFRPRYLGYYSSLDAFTVDRTEWYYNPAEERRLWNNGLDDEYPDPAAPGEYIGDDPDGDLGMRILYDDRGSLMFRKVLDDDMLWAEWYKPEWAEKTAAGKVHGDRVKPNDYRDNYHGPYSRGDFPPQADELAGPLTPQQLKDKGDITAITREELIAKGYIVDTGTVIGEGFSDLRFQYVYKLPGESFFRYADWWPWDNNSDPTDDVSADMFDPNLPAPAALPPGNKKLPHTNIGWQIGGSWDLTTDPQTKTPNARVYDDFDITYFSLPLAVSAKFTFKMGRHYHVYEKMIFLHSSRWLKYLNP
jgi:type II secretory pathway pseudopilin PulG